MRIFVFFNFFLFICVPTASANSKKTELFAIGIIHTVCIKSKCQGYSKIENIQVELVEQNENPNNYFGEAIYNYKVEDVQFTSKVQISEFEFNGSKQMNFYLNTSEDGNLNKLGSAEVIVESVADLKSTALYSVPIERRDLQISPILMIGPSPLSISKKLASLPGF